MVVSATGSLRGAYRVSKADSKAQQNTAADDHGDVVSGSIKGGAAQVEDAGTCHVELHSKP